MAISSKKEAILSKKAEVLLKPAPVVSSSDKYSALRDLLGEGENSSSQDKGGLISEGILNFSKSTFDLMSIHLSGFYFWGSKLNM